MKHSPRSARSALAHRRRALAPCRAAFAPLTPAPAPTAGIVLLDLSGRVLVGSEQAARLLGLDTPAALVGRAPLFDPETTVGADGSRLGAADQSTWLQPDAAHSREEVTLAVRGADGQTVWLRVGTERLVTIDGSPYAILTRLAPVGQP